MTSGSIQLAKKETSTLICLLVSMIPAKHFTLCNSGPQFHDAFEPPHDKTNKMTVRSAKTQISLGMRPV